MSEAKRTEEEKIAAMDKKELFLMKYEDLCKKYNMYISSCGCCNGPEIITKEEIKKWKIRETFKEMLNNNVKHLGS